MGFRKLCNATTISKPLFRKTSIPKKNYFASCVMQLLFRNHYFAKQLFRKKKTISKNYYFAKKNYFENNYFAKLLFRKTTTLCNATTISQKKNYFEKLLFRKNFYFEKQLFQKITISQVV